MYDLYNRKINYLRISVTDRCNLRCVYCMPAEGVVPLSHSDILSFNEIVELVRVAVSMGVDKVRLTGGEPLVRKGIVELVRMLAGLEGIRDLAMTTNALLLTNMAEDLKRAGLHRVNVSLDSLDPKRFSEISRGGDLNAVLRGLDAAEKAGLNPIKINCVIQNSSKEPDAQSVGEFARSRGWAVRFIHLMNLEKGYFKPVEGGDGGNCAVCNRLRLTSNGLIMPCLFSTKGFSVRELGPSAALEKALQSKPKCGGVNPDGSFYGIGG